MLRFIARQHRYTFDSGFCRNILTDSRTLKGYLMNPAVHEAPQTTEASWSLLSRRRERQSCKGGYHCDRCQEAGSQGPGWDRALGGQGGRRLPGGGDPCAEMRWWAMWLGGSGMPQQPRKAEGPQSEETRQTWGCRAFELQQEDFPWPPAGLGLGSVSLTLHRPVARALPCHCTLGLWRLPNPLGEAS